MGAVAWLPTKERQKTRLHSGTAASSARHLVFKRLNCAVEKYLNAYDAKTTQNVPTTRDRSDQVCLKTHEDKKPSNLVVAARHLHATEDVNGLCLHAVARGVHVNNGHREADVDSQLTEILVAEHFQVWRHEIL